jgi:hypothetical protein
MTTIAEHKLNVIRQVDELTEESLIEVEKLITQLKANQATKVLKKPRQPPASIAGKMKILGDLIEPCFELKENNEDQAIHLKTEDMAFFLQVLENPPKANKALKQAAHWHKQLINHA